MWRKKKNYTKYSGHFVPQQRPRAAHALCSDQFGNSRGHAEDKQVITLFIGAFLTEIFANEPGTLEHLNNKLHFSTKHIELSKLH